MLHIPEIMWQRKEDAAAGLYSFLGKSDVSAEFDMSMNYSFQDKFSGDQILGGLMITCFLLFCLIL